MIRVSDLVDSYRDLLSGATDMYLAMVANRQGEVNKQLTIIATIFLPLTFLTGFFGQNFSLPRPCDRHAPGRSSCSDSACWPYRPSSSCGSSGATDGSEPGTSTATAFAADT